MNRPKLLILAAAACALALAIPASAQQEQPSPWWTVSSVKVKPDKDTEFQDLLGNHWIPAVRKAGTAIYTWRIARFGDSFEYSFVSPMKNFAMFDGASPVMKALEKDEYAILYERLRDCILSVETTGLVAHAELSFDKSPTDTPRMAVLNTTRVRPDKVHEYQALIKEMLPHLEKTSHRGFWTYQQVFGGSTSVWLHLVLIDKFADLDAGSPLVRALGREKAKEYDDRLAALVYDEELYVLAHLPEFSHVPDQ